MFVEPDEDKTPVTSDPFVRLEHHQRKFEGSQTLALGEIKALHQKIDATNQKIDAVTDRHDKMQEKDEREHKRLNDSIMRIANDSAGVRARVDTMGTQIDGAVEKMQETSVAQATVTGQMSILMDDYKATRRLQEHEQKVTTETEAMIKRTTTTEFALDNDAKRKRNAKILQIVGAALGSGGLVFAIVLGLLSRC